MALPRRTPTTAYRSGITIGQLAAQWRKDTAFVKALVADAFLQTNEQGVISNSSLRTYYRDHGSPRD